jgi:hypothetical protein
MKLIDKKIAEAHKLPFTLSYQFFLKQKNKQRDV